MVFIWGTKGEHDHLGYVIHECPECSHGVFSVQQVKRKFTVFFVPTFSYSDKQLLVCTSCQATYEVTEEIKQSVADNLMTQEQLAAFIRHEGNPYDGLSGGRSIMATNGDAETDKPEAESVTSDEPPANEPEAELATSDEHPSDEPETESASNDEPPTEELEAEPATSDEPPIDELDAEPASSDEPPADEPDAEPAQPAAVTASRMEAMAARAWKPFIAIGFAIVLISFAVGLRASFTAGDYYAVDKVTREAAGMGSDLAGKKAWIESTKVWLPTFKFLGVGMLLGGVSLLLATILAALRDGGRESQKALGVEVRLMEPPMTAKVFPWLMALGMMLLIAAFAIGIVVARLSFDYWDHSIVDNLDPATKGLLKDLRAINTVTLWLEPLKFVGMALMLTSIGLALATVARALRWQTDRTREMLS